MLRTTVSITGMPARPDGRVDLVVDGQLTDQKATSAGDVVRINPASGESTVERGAIGTVHFGGLPAGDKTIEIWLPNSERTEVVGLRTDRTDTAATTRRAAGLDPPRQLDQPGLQCRRPQHHLARDRRRLARTSSLVNLGLAGSAMLDPFTARAIRDARRC